MSVRVIRVAALLALASCDGDRGAPVHAGDVDWAALATVSGDAPGDAAAVVTPAPSDTSAVAAGDASASGGDAGDSGPIARDASLDVRPAGARFSERFAAEYRDQIRDEMAELEKAISERRAKLQAGAPLSAKEKMLREREQADRSRLARRPYLSQITDEQIADFLSYNPQLASGEDEIKRVVADNRESIPICADHARWLSARDQLEPATVEYRRCMTLPGVTEQQMRYFNLQITALQNEMHPKK